VNVRSLKDTLKGGLLALFVLSAMSAFAASKGGLQLQHPTNVGGKQLATGSYTVRWEGTGEQVDLKVYQGKKEVASTSARVVKIDQPASYDQTITSAGNDGSSALTEIRFRGKNFALQLNGEGGSSSSSGAAQ
jgi:hypothetical protein